MKLKNIFGVLAVVMIIAGACKKDDSIDVQIVPPRDQAEQYAVDNDSIVEFLQTHFYNYEAFENASSNPDFDFEIVYDTIAGANADKTPLFDQVQIKVVKTDEVDFNLYYLNPVVGNGPQIQVTDSTLVTYTGRLLDNTQFDQSPNPIWFDLTRTVRGFGVGFAKFKAGSGEGVTNNPDGTVNFSDFSVGAIFMPSGLAYFASANGSVPVYSPLTFTFKIFLHNETDHDQDGIPSYLEDVDENENPFDDDTDGDFLNNYNDADDDNDGTLTKDEIVIDENGVITYTDTDGDGIPDYLDNKNN
jgi:FKBP-type peptidyl-prolyl cis-trans isomerase